VTCRAGAQRPFVPFVATVVWTARNWEPSASASRIGQLVERARQVPILVAAALLCWNFECCRQHTQGPRKRLSRVEAHPVRCLTINIEAGAWNGRVQEAVAVVILEPALPWCPETSPAEHYRRPHLASGLQDESPL
jgi:hypothetical protein